MPTSERNLNPLWKLVTNLTFLTGVGQNGPGPDLFPFCGFPRAGVRAGGPRRPHAEHAVLWAGGVTGNRDREDGISAQLSVNFFSWGRHHHEQSIIFK